MQVNFESLTIIIQCRRDENETKNGVPPVKVIVPKVTACSLYLTGTQRGSLQVGGVGNVNVTCLVKCSRRRVDWDLGLSRGFLPWLKSSQSTASCVYSRLTVILALSGAQPVLVKIDVVDRIE